MRGALVRRPPTASLYARFLAPVALVLLALSLLLPVSSGAAADWGPVLPPLGGEYFTYSDPGGRYTARIPNAWTKREDASPNSVLFRDPATLWGAELALNDGSAFAAVEQADPIIDGQVRQLANYRPISLDKVMVGPHNAFRRVFEHTNNEGQTETIVRIYFLAGPWLYNVNGFMLTPDYGRVSPLVDGIAGSIAVAGAAPAPTPVPLTAVPPTATPTAAPTATAPPAPTATAPAVPTATAPAPPTAVPATATLPPAPTATAIAPGTAVPTVMPTASPPRPTTTSTPQILPPPTPPATGSGGNLPGLPNTGDGGGPGGGFTLGAALLAGLLALLAGLRVRITRRRA